MPEGSSSEAPVISPGPRLLTKSLNANGLADSVFASGLPCCAFRDRFEATFLRFAMPAPNRRTNVRARGPVPVTETGERRSIAARGRNCVHTVVAEHMRHQPRRPEYLLECGIANAQAPGIG